MKAAALEHAIPFNPVDRIRAPKGRKKYVPAFSTKEYEKFLVESQNNPNRFIYQLDFDMGIRSSELRAIPIKNVNFARGEIYISQHFVDMKIGGKWQPVLLPSTKTGRNYFAKFTIYGEEAIRGALALQEQYKKNNPNFNNKYGLVFVDHNGDPLMYSRFYRGFCRYRKAIGNKELTPHSIRHTYVTVALQVGKDPKSVQEQVGHSDLDTTFSYARSSEEAKNEMVTKLSEYQKQRREHVLRMSGSEAE